MKLVNVTDKNKNGFLLTLKTPRGIELNAEIELISITIVKSKL